MNPFVISPQETQAIQKDEMQLVMALAQVSQRVGFSPRRLAHLACDPVREIGSAAGILH